MHYLLGVVALLWGLFFVPSAAAEDLVISRAVLEDATHDLSISDVVGREFQPIGVSLVKGYTESAHWLRLQVRAPVRGNEVVLRIYPTNLDEVQLYEAGPDGWQTRVTGDRYPYAERDRAATVLSFVVDIHAPQATYYLRLQTSGLSRLHVVALEPHEVQRLELHLSLVWDVFLGVMLWALVWALHHYAMEREPLVGLLALNQAAFILYSITIMGYIALLVPASAPQWADTLSSVLICASQFTSVLFTRSLLGRYEPAPWLMRGFDLLLLAFPLQLLCLALGQAQLALQSNALLIVVSRVYFTAVAFSARQEGTPSLRFMRHAHVVLMLLTTLIVVSHVGLLPVPDSLFVSAMFLIVYSITNSSLLVAVVHARLKAVHRTAEQSSLALALSEQALDLERTHRREAQHLARTDFLTGLTNRRHFVERAEQAIARALREQQPLALLMIDLDHFKALNDTLGHGVGDVVLQRVSQRLQQTLREGDIVGRIGGEEFAVVLVDADTERAMALAHRLRRAVADTPCEPLRHDDHPTDGHGVRVTVSLGLAELKGRHIPLGQLLKEADQALYVAKAGGRDALKLHDEEIGQRAQLRAQITQELATALEYGELSLDYQPVFGADGRQPVSVEALLRWNHPRLGRVPPQTFVDVAEDTGLIVPIGAWVLHQACHDAMRWPQPLKVAVNLSVRQLHSHTLIDEVSAALAQSGLPAHRLELEVTESALAREASAAGALDALRALGVGLALDDFGTGFSSLAYLQRFRFDRLKIDRAFVLPLQFADNHTPVALVRAVIDLAGVLGLKCTAEGIETAGQLQILSELGCGAMQGFHLARPMGRDAVREFLTDAHRPVGATA